MRLDNDAVVPRVDPVDRDGPIYRAPVVQKDDADADQPHLRTARAHSEMPVSRYRRVAGDAPHARRVFLSEVRAILRSVFEVRHAADVRHTVGTHKSAASETGNISEHSGKSTGKKE